LVTETEPEVYVADCNKKHTYLRVQEQDEKGNGEILVVRYWW
jgi:hypothetical protein